MSKPKDFFVAVFDKEICAEPVMSFEPVSNILLVLAVRCSLLIAFESAIEESWYKDKNPSHFTASIEKSVFSSSFPMSHRFNLPDSVMLSLLISLRGVVRPYLFPSKNSCLDPPNIISFRRLLTFLGFSFAENNPQFTIRSSRQHSSYESIAYQVNVLRLNDFKSWFVIIYTSPNIFGAE